MKASEMPRYMVCTSAGRGFQVWDRHERRVARRFASMSAAINDVKRRNRKERDADA